MKRILRTLLAASLVAISTSASAGAETVIIPVYDLSGRLSEGGTSEPSLLSLDFSFSTGRQITHFDLVRSLHKAAQDERVKGVVLEIDQAGFSLAQVQELRRRLEAIRGAGKDVWLYSDTLGRGTALFGSTANHFVLMPVADVSLLGMHSESLYFKGLFDKVGVTADVVHIGDFKSAGESFYRTGPSEPALRQMNELYDGMYEQTVAAIAAGRTEPEKVRAFIDAGHRTPQQVVEAGLADDLQHRTDFIKTVRAHYGEKAKFDRSYELPSTSGPEIDSMFDVFSLLFSSGSKKKFRRDYFAVVVLDSDITTASIAPVRKEILAAARNEKCRGLVFRINSPGGSALASEVLWEATEEFKATGKPFVVSMGGVAASGGYYVASSAEKIFAEEGTVTGSIGVVGMKIAMGGAMDLLGITSHELKRGRHADLQNTNRPFSDEERALVQAMMTEIYGVFKKRITDGRGDRLKGDLESLAGGRVYTGARALEIGLVDEIGGLHEAIAYLAKKLELDPAATDLYLLPEPTDFLTGLLAPPEKAGKDDEFIRMEDGVKPVVALQTWLLANPAVQALDPAKREALGRFAARLEAFQSERVLLLAPHFATTSIRN